MPNIPYVYLLCQATMWDVRAEYNGFTSAYKGSIDGEPAKYCDGIRHVYGVGIEYCLDIGNPGEGILGSHLWHVSQNRHEGFNDD